jgi:hypothetical protein
MGEALLQFPQPTGERQLRPAGERHQMLARGYGLDFTDGGEVDDGGATGPSPIREEVGDKCLLQEFPGFLGRGDHSKRRASMGSSWAALRAG